MSNTKENSRNSVSGIKTRYDDIVKELSKEERDYLDAESICDACFVLEDVCSEIS